MIEQATTTQTPVDVVLRARRAGIKLWISDAGTIKASLPSGAIEIPAWLREAKTQDEGALAFAVAIVAAVERSGGDPRQLRSVKTLVFEAGTQ